MQAALALVAEKDFLQRTNLPKEVCLKLTFRERARFYSENRLSTESPVEMR